MKNRRPLRKNKDGSYSRPGLYANIHAKRKRGEAPARKGSPSRPSAKDFKMAAKTAKS